MPNFGDVNKGKRRYSIAIVIELPDMLRGISPGLAKDFGELAARYCMDRNGILLGTFVDPATDPVSPEQVITDFLSDIAAGQPVADVFKKHSDAMQAAVDFPLSSAEVEAATPAAELKA